MLGLDVGDHRSIDRTNPVQFGPDLIGGLCSRISYSKLRRIRGADLNGHVADARPRVGDDASGELVHGLASVCVGLNKGVDSHALAAEQQGHRAKLPLEWVQDHSKRLERHDTEQRAVV